MKEREGGKGVKRSELDFPCAALRGCVQTSSQKKSKLDPGFKTPPYPREPRLSYDKKKE